jgi:hypothetical protein
MKNHLKSIGLALLIASCARANAATLVNEGVLGNSGEAGQSLVRFGGKFRDSRAFTQPQGMPTEAGMGVVLDRFGFLWDRGGTGVLNRYAVDGRLVGQYKIPPGAAQNDQLTLVGDNLILQLKSKLYSLPVTSPNGSEARPLNRDSQAISFGTFGGKFASLQGAKIFLIDAASGAATELMDTPTGRINQIELMPGGTLAVDGDGDVRLFSKGQAPEHKSSPGGSLQFLDGYWYGHQWHGTTKRFDADFNAAPGVVLGGASGSFIGHLEGNYEISSARGLAKVGPNLFAISGLSGVLHLLQWQGDANRFEIVRRIGSVAACRGIALDDAGFIRANTGAWKWSDGPATPQTLGSPILLCGPPALLSNGTVVAPAVQYGNSGRIITLRNGDIGKPDQLKGEEKFFAKGIIGSVAYKAENKFWLALLFGDGSARRYRISGSGDFQNEAADAAITPATPIKQWTSLVMQDESTLLGAGDGLIIELKREGEGWKETRRWNDWDSDKFGAHIEVAVNAGRLWVCDTERHRVLCFELAGKKLLASFGTVDKSGDDLSTLAAPTEIAARGSRAVVFDSGNQRLIKLALQ